MNRDAKVERLRDIETTVELVKDNVPKWQRQRLLQRLTGYVQNGVSFFGVLRCRQGGDMFDSFDDTLYVRGGPKHVFSSMDESNEFAGDKFITTMLHVDTDVRDPKGVYTIVRAPYLLAWAYDMDDVLDIHPVSGVEDIGECLSSTDIDDTKLFQDSHWPDTVSDFVTQKAEVAQVWVKTEDDGNEMVLGWSVTGRAVDDEDIDPTKAQQVLYGEDSDDDEDPHETKRQKVELELENKVMKKILAQVLCYLRKDIESP